MISVSFDGSDRAAISELNQKDPQITEALRFGVSQEAAGLATYIGFSKVQQVLNSRSGKLAASIRVGETRVTEKTISAEVLGAGGVAGYGRVHEFGGTFSYTRRLRLTGSSQVTVHYPERSYMRAGMRDRRSAIIDSVRQRVEKSVA